MRRTLLLIILLVAGLSGCTSRYRSPGLLKKSYLKDLPPPSHFSSGWERERSPAYYVPDNLYKYIDGAAELYFDYGFKQLIATPYLYREKEGTTLIVDIYNMGSRLNAFGIYSCYRNSEAQFLKIGAEAFLTNYALAFYKGKFFVYLQTGTPSPETSSAMRKAAQLIEEKILEPSEPPGELKYLPRKNLIAGTPRYMSERLLGYHFLPGGLQAQYLSEGTKVLLFVALSSSAQQAETSLRKYSEHIKKAGQGLTFLTGFSGETFSAADPYYGKTIVSRYEEFIVGATNLPDFKEGELLLRAALQEIKLTRKKNPR